VRFAARYCRAIICHPHRIQVGCVAKGAAVTVSHKLLQRKCRRSAERPQLLHLPSPVSAPPQRLAPACRPPPSAAMPRCSARVSHPRWIPSGIRTPVPTQPAGTRRGACRHLTSAAVPVYARWVAAIALGAAQTSGLCSLRRRWLLLRVQQRGFFWMRSFTGTADVRRARSSGPEVS